MSDESLNERESQLSAMFDNELPGAECELLARRLTRDEALRSQWSRFAMIGAALRAERGVALHDRVAWRVQASITQEVTYGDGVAIDVAASNTRSSVATVRTKVAVGERWMRFARPVLGASIAAGVAATSIFWMRNNEPVDSMLASNAVPQSVVLAPEAVGATVALNESSPSIGSAAPVSNGEPDRYVTPAPSSQANFAPSARLANYVVAHSEYSGPLSRRMALLGLVSSENPADAPGVTEIKPPAPQPANASRATDAP
jgi:sigma-E factor negative regulatory protein RseA